MANGISVLARGFKLNHWFNISFCRIMTDCQKLNVKLLLTRAEAGSIIGIRGGNISKLRGETNVCLHISKDKTEQRILSIRGNQENAYAALENIFDTIDERNTGLRKRPLKLL